MSAALITKLLAVGTPHELVAEVAMELARAQVATAVLEERRAKDRARKRVPRISEESAEPVEIAEIHDKGSLEVSPENPLPKPSKSNPLNPPKKGRFPAPAGVTDEQWLSFGRQRKKPWSERSYTLVCNKLDSLAADGHDRGVLVDLAIENNWETVWPPRQIRDQVNSDYVSASGYRYRGDDKAVMREAEKRADWGTYWKAKSNIDGERQSANG
jgi:hypothetical protein